MDRRLLVRASSIWTQEGGLRAAYRRESAITYIGMKTCPVCEGEGQLEYEVPVVDYNHGGYLDTEWGDCDHCGGTGEVEDWEVEE